MANKGWGCGSILLIILFIIGIGSLMDKTKQSGPNVSSTTQFSPEPRPLKAEALKSVKIKDFKWYKAGFGQVMIVDITIENKCPYDIKDLSIKCIHRSKSGTEIDVTSGTIYDFVKAGKTKTFKNVNLGFVHSQSASCNCEVTGLEFYYEASR
ncbi:MAG: zinc ribbon domain-containing protein [Desulfobaccales bacterium]